MHRVIYGIGVLLVASLSLPFTSAQDITVRLANAKSGKPLRSVPVTIFTWNGPPTYRSDNVPPGQIVLHLTTDADGRAVFRSPQPPLEHIGFDVGTPWDFAGCWRLHDPSPEMVLRSGVIADYTCGKRRWPVSAKPGEVVIVERKLRLWEKMCREIP
jgi:hypothetical protein